MLRKRMAKALGKKSHGVEVSISETDQDSFFQIGSACLGANDATFVQLASTLAIALAKAQNNRSLNASKLVVIGGTVTAHARPYLAVVKAELQDALTERPGRNASAIDHLRNIFMTESQRLYKIGFLQRTVARASHSTATGFAPHQHSVHLFDHLMTALETRSAAHYFYSGFLGCQTATSARSRTRDFYDQTREFINTSNFPEAKRFDLMDALRTDLRSNVGTVSTDDFSAAHMSARDRTAYITYMANKGFPAHAVFKDIEYVQTKLKRRRKITFTSGVTVTTPPDHLDFVTVVTNNDGSSTVHIQGTEESRE